MIGWMQRWRARFRGGLLREVLAEFRWMLGYSVHYRAKIAWYIALGVFSTAMSLGVGVMSKYIIDAVTSGGSRLLPFAAGYVVMSLLQIGVGAWSGRVSARIQVEVTREIRSGVFGKILSADWEALSEYHSGDLLTRINGDVNTVAMSVLGWIPDFVTSFVRFGGTLLLILYYDPTMALLALASAPFTLLTSRMLMRKIRGHNENILRINSELTAFNEEAFQNLQSIKAFSLMGRYQDAFEEKQSLYGDAQLAFNRFTTFTSAVMSVAGLLVTGACFGWGAYRLWSGAITYGTMTLFLQQAGGLSNAFYTLANTAPNAIRAATSAGRIMKLTRLPQEPACRTEETAAFRQYAAAHGGVTIRVDRLSFGYRDGGQVLKDVSLCAMPREVVALVGPSGEGKTTLLKLLLGLVSAQQGTVCAASGSRELPISPATRPLFAYVPQGNTMMSGTVRENLRLLRPDATDPELWAVLEDVCAADFVRDMPQGLDTYLKERGGGLSEGQLQRLAIARALLCDAPVLLLDEATSALDVATERRLLRNVMQSARTKTCIVTTHRPSVLSLCSRVYRVSEHDVSQIGPEEIRRMLLEF